MKCSLIRLTFNDIALIFAIDEMTKGAVAPFAFNSVEKLFFQAVADFT